MESGTESNERNAEPIQMQQASPGWYPQAEGQSQYWDGSQWTDVMASPMVETIPGAFVFNNQSFWSAYGRDGPIAGTSWSLVDETQIYRTFNWGRFLLSLLGFLVLAWVLIGFLFLFIGFSWTEHVSGHLTVTVREPSGDVVIGYSQPQSSEEIATVLAQVNTANQFATWSR